jgi:hypothetical protein
MSFYQNPYFNHTYTPATYESLSAIPALSGWNPLERFDYVPYLCQLLKTANLNYVDPVIKIEKEGGFDYEHFLDSYYAQLTALGEPRVNFGELWKQAGIDLLPRALTQIEIAQSGGCQVIDNYICDADGNRIKQASATCKEGDEYLKPITAQEIVEYATNFIQNKYNKHADDFAEYVKRNFIDKGWEVNLLFYDKMYIFYVEATKNRRQENEEREYLKYYQNSRKHVSDKLGIPITIKNGYFLENDNPENFRKMINHFVLPSIPNYGDLL